MNESKQLPETTLRDYVRVIFRHEGIVFLTIITVCAAVFAGLKLKTPVYESRVKMLITAEKQVEATYYKEMYEGRNVQQTLTQSEIVKSTPVLNRVVRALALDKRPVDDEKKFASPLKALLIDYQTLMFNEKMEGISPAQRENFLFSRAVESLRKSIKVEPIRDTNMFTISVSDYNPVGAALIANVVSRAYVIFDLEQQLAELKLKYGGKHPTVNLIEDSIAQLQGTLDGQPIDDIKAIGPASVKIMEQASVAIGSQGTPKVLTLALAAVMSVFLAVMLAFVFDFADQTLKTPADVARNLDLPVISSVRRFRFGNNRLIKNARVKSRYFQSYRNIADGLCLLFKNKELNSLLVTSATANEGSEKIVANAGFYMAKVLQYSVLIIDADLRTAALSRKLKVKRGKGLALYLEGHASIDEIITNGGVGPDLIAAGETDINPVTLLESQRMSELIKTATMEYEVVLINCVNVRDYQDASVLSSLVDGTALTINEGVTRRQVVANACAQLKDSNAKLKGVIFNNRTLPIPKFIYDRV